MIPIFLYHRIDQVPEHHDPRGLAVRPKLFEQQMAYLHREGYQCVTLGEAVNYWRDGLHRPRKSFVLTFDDGYRDLYTNVWPILERYGFSATVFLVAERVGLKSNWEGQTGPTAVPLLSWEEIHELARLGFTFGSHTLTHPRLKSLDDEQARFEIRQSKTIIEDQIGIKVDFFAYPFADFDTRIQHMVAESGYLAACGVDRGDGGLFNLWRLECLSTESWRSFNWKGKGWYYQFIWLREQTHLGRILRKVVRLFR